tara:strand:- start:1498 stop:1992 length:495 start_codon:yes stop_codon:yes gene_type:complete
MIRTLTLAAALCFAPAALAQDGEMGEVERIARDYMAAYSAVDFETMSTFMADDIVFSDPTATGTDNPDGILETGRDALLAMLESFAAEYNPIGLNFTWDTVFESNGRVVFMGHVNATYPTDQPGQVFRWRAAQTAVVTVRGGRVVRHQDFADYAHAEQGLVPAE